jgi:tetratricopeptide (TPR) repeat protein
MYLYFALGKIYEDLGEFEKAFACVREGNRIKRATYAYDIKRDNQFFANLKAVFSKQFCDRYESCGHKNNTPIFILGMPRSGTSLVEQILSSHPLVYGADELKELSQIVLASCRNFSGGEFPGCIVNYRPQDFERLGARYIESIQQYSSKNHITDKMPHNFMYIGMIRLMLPNAKIIHCKRDPLDNCWSLFKTLFAPPHEYAYDLSELGEYYKHYQDLMEHWHLTFPGYIHDIQYENLVTDQKLQTVRLLEYCGLEWHDDCLLFYQAQRRVSTASAVQIRQPIYRSSVHLWKQYKKQLSQLSRILHHSNLS